MYLIGNSSVKENNQQLKDAFKPCFDELRHLQANGLNGITVEVWTTDDWKCLMTLRGVTAAMSNYFCLWCTCHKSQRMDPKLAKVWKVEPDRYEHKRGSYGLNKHEEDLIDFIPVSRTVGDILHLFLRTFDRLFEVFVADVFSIYKNDRAVEIATIDEASDRARGRATAFNNNKSRSTAKRAMPKKPKHEDIHGEEVISTLSHSMTRIYSFIYLYIFDYF